MRDWSVTGSFDFQVDYVEGEPAAHAFQSELVDPDDAEWQADVLLLKIEGPCVAYAEGSFARISSGGSEAELLVVEDPDPCDLCWPWTLDGVAQEEPACIQL